MAEKVKKQEAGFRKVSDVVKLGKRPLCFKENWYRDASFSYAGANFVFFWISAFIPPRHTDFPVWSVIFGSICVILLFFGFRELFRPECPACFDDEKIVFRSGKETPWDKLDGVEAKPLRLFDLWGIRTFESGKLILHSHGKIYVIWHVADVNHIADAVWKKKYELQEGKRPDSHGGCSHEQKREKENGIPHHQRHRQAGKAFFVREVEMVCRYRFNRGRVVFHHTFA